MNRNDRRKLAAAARKYCGNAGKAADEFAAVVEELKAAEEEKQENIPESLRESSQAGNIEESIDRLETLLDSIEGAAEACQEIADQAGVDITYEALSIPTATDTGPRNCRFQILLTEQLLSRLRQRSTQTGLSCNEIIYRALKQELEE